MRQAGAGAATVLSAVCHHDPDRLHPGHIPASHSALYPLHTDDMFPLDLLQQELVSLLAPDTEAFLTVFGPLLQHCQQEAASTSLCCCLCPN